MGHKRAGGPVNLPDRVRRLVVKAFHGPLDTDERVEETAGNFVMVQPLTAAAVTWLDEYADASPWQWQGGALAVDHRTVAALVEGMVSAGLDVEGYEAPEVPEGEPAPGSVEELEAYTNAQRTLAKVEGDLATVKAMDAVKAAEEAGLSPLALHLAGDAARAHEEGLSMLEWQRDIVRRHGEAPAWLTPTVEELKRADLLPWKETSPRKEPETP